MPTPEQEQERKILTIEYFSGIIEKSVRSKMGTLPSLSAISLAMLVIATLNPELIPLPFLWAKIIISVLLISIPTTLWFFIFDTQESCKESFEVIKKDLGESTLGELKNYEQKFINRIIGLLPSMMTAIYSIIVFIILFYMWRDSLFISIPLIIAFCLLLFFWADKILKPLFKKTN